MRTSVSVSRVTGTDAVTLDQLAKFVQGAMRANVPGDTQVTGRVSMRGRLIGVTLEADLSGDEVAGIVDR